MSKIAYDPVKDQFARIINKSRFLRTVFYKLLDLFFLRSWHVRKKLRDIADPLDEGDWNVLDAGCGFGQYDRFILNHFDHVRVQAVDVKEDYLGACRQYFFQDIQNDRIRFNFADLITKKWEKQFDAAICIDVLEHIEEDVQVMQNVGEGLHEGGYFLMHSPSVYAEEDAGDDEFFVDEHARVGYSKDELEKKFKQAGLTPVDIQYTYGKAGHFAWELLIKYPMLAFTKFGIWVAPVVAIYYIPALPVGLIGMWMDLRSDNEKGTGILGLARK